MLIMTNQNLDIKDLIILYENSVRSEEDLKKGLASATKEELEAYILKEVLTSDDDEDEEITDGSDLEY